jgi:hypothetical protein
MRDVNDDGAVDPSDPVGLLNNLGALPLGGRAGRSMGSRCY